MSRRPVQFSVTVPVIFPIADRDVVPVFFQRQFIVRRNDSGLSRRTTQLRIDSVQPLNLSLGVSLRLANSLGHPRTGPPSSRR